VSNGPAAAPTPRSSSTVAPASSELAVTTPPLVEIEDTEGPSVPDTRTVTVAPDVLEAPWLTPVPTPRPLEGNGGSAPRTAPRLVASELPWVTAPGRSVSSAVAGVPLPDADRSESDATPAVADAVGMPAPSSDAEAALHATLEDTDVASGGGKLVVGSAHFWERDCDAPGAFAVASCCTTTAGATSPAARALTGAPEPALTDDVPAASVWPSSTTRKLVPDAETEYAGAAADARSVPDSAGAIAIAAPARPSRAAAAPTGQLPQPNQLNQLNQPRFMGVPFLRCRDPHLRHLRMGM
jgi:hypothetical protein